MGCSGFRVQVLGFRVVLANVTGHLTPEQCPDAPKDLQIAIRTISALDATLSKQSFGGRFGTLWKVTMAASALSKSAPNRAVLASNGAASLILRLLEQPNVSARAQEHACRIALDLAYDPATRTLLLRDAPGLPQTLTKTYEHGNTALNRAIAEAVLWALEVPPPPPAPPPGGEEEGGGRSRHVMICHTKGHWKVVQCLTISLRALGYDVLATGSEGTPNLTPGVRSCGLMLVLLSEELQCDPLSRAELLVASETQRPVVRTPKGGVGWERV